MNEEFQASGKWWLPTHPERVVNGILEYQPGDGAALKLHGSLMTTADLSDPYSHEQLEDLLLVLGATSRGFVTLYQCKLLNENMNFEGVVDSSIYYIEYVLIGTHLQTEGDLRFNHISVHFGNMDEWMNSDPFIVDLNDHPKAFTVQFDGPDPVRFSVDDLAISLEIKPQISHKGRSELKLSQKAWIVVRSQEKWPLETWLELVRQFQNFMSLVMAYPTKPLSVRVDIPDDETESHGFFTTVQICYVPGFWFTQGSDYVSAASMLANLSQINDEIQLCLGNWIAKYGNLKPCLDLHFGALYNPQLYLEVKFLMRVQAVESFHRRTIGGKYQDDTTWRAGPYDELITAIPASVKGGFRESLKNKLLYVNEYSLKKRLGELVDRVKPCLSFDLFDSTFINEVCDTRNYLTHYDPKLELKAVMEPDDLLVLTDKLRALLDLSLLLEIGLRPDRICLMLGESDYERRLLRQ